ncbi:MAG: NAD-dependent epimerase/dehydratase family protein [Patescibacteria group bacterium]|nr:NAD-dependent epimerase/dehydratase family protein [Patescibacteria group bacterium]
MQQRNIAVVTGGAGFIGSHLSKALLGRGYEVRVVDDLSSGKRERVPKGASFHNLDVRDRAKLLDISRGASAMFHLAANASVQYSLEHPEETNDINVHGTLAALQTAREAGVTRFVFSGSSAIYGDQEADRLNENLPPRLKSPYGLQKYVGELYCRLYAEAYGLGSVSLRYFNVYGEGARTSGPYAPLIALFLKQQAEGRPLTVTGDGKQTRDFIHVRDVVAANLLAAESSMVGHGEAINIGSGAATSVNEIAALIGGKVEHVPARLEPRRSLADPSLARKLLAWQPTISLRDGIEELKRGVDLN